MTDWRRVVLIRIEVPDNVDMEAVVGQVMNTIVEDAPTHDGGVAQLKANWITMGEDLTDWLWEDFK